MDKSKKHSASGLPQKYVGKLSDSTAKARKAHWKKMNKLSDRDPRAYEPAPGDATAKTKPSKATKEVRKIMSNEEIEITEAAENSLAAKAKKFNVSLGTLKTVYKRGVAAWNSGHRPGTTAQQWGHARVNSYLRKGKGTYHGADKDLREAKDSREYGYEGEMAMSQLKGIMNHAKQLHDMLEPSTDLPEWVQSKITLAYDYMQTAADYMATEMNEEAGQIHSVHVRTYDKRGEKQINSKEFKQHLKNNGGEVHYMSDKGVAFKFKHPHHADAFHSGIQSKFRDLGSDGKESMHEEVQIDELSKDTLKSYVNKADARLMDRTIDNPKAHKKAQNRTFGIEKAVKKIREEAAVNSVGAGNVAGLQGEPPVHMKKKKNIMTFNRFMKK